MSDASQAILTVQAREVAAQDFQPILNVQQAIERKEQLNAFIAKVMVDGLDYGSLPGYGKPELLKPGAEKLCSLFGLAPRYVAEKIIEDWGTDQTEALFFYRYTCQLWRGDRLMGEASGSCNSRESKYRYRWISAEDAQRRPDFDRLPSRGGRQFEPQFAINKADTTGKYGKPAEYWKRFRDGIEDGTATKITDRQMGAKKYDGWEIDTTVYRVANPDVADQVNTVLKISQKRALVAAVLVVTNASDAFTQDLEDLHDGPTVAQAEVQQQRMAQESSKADQRQAEPDDEKLTALLKKIAADSNEAEPTAGDLMMAIKELMGSEMSERTWTSFVRQHGEPGKAKDKTIYWILAVRALYSALKEMQARAEKTKA